MPLTVTRESSVDESPVAGCLLQTSSSWRSPRAIIALPIALPIAAGLATPFLERSGSFGSIDAWDTLFWDGFQRYSGDHIRDTSERGVRPESPSPQQPSQFITMFQANGAR